MNISVYLPDNLKSRFDSYVKNKGLTTNAAIRKAVELLLNQEKKSKWGDWINHIEPDTEFPSVDDLRKDLIPPKETIF
ncbi:MAG: ribbon-helix-helix domain-containing protein [Imperialibacter sp.]|jgi:Arc/MetJ-type ribon-helix-helix transcriptional regulator|uniref:Ribbon-helix-helix domain-containing protein n=1 Tax=Imperialibacter roseus TaxID=1324217 RepID=A0ABZ0J0A0_9BACT|nr:ribbon-helix-helix domain-containing protein [Imperialibacter roseus]WOK09367.1 ribbon-helix-helix domain-containing protein [Imperialibacter roseus]